MRWTIVALGLISLAGLAALATLLVNGSEPGWRWGYVAAALSVLLSAGQMAPLVSLTSRLGRGFWGAPLRRISDLLALSGVVAAPLLVLLLTRLPDWRGRASIWSDWPGAPGVWDASTAIGVALTGIALVWLATWPDRGGPRWTGSQKQWTVLTRGLISVGCLYAMLLVFLHLLVASDLVLSLVPGWHSSVLAPYHVVSGFELGLALVIVALGLLHWLHASVSIGVDLFHACAKILLSLALLWFYFTWCELLTDWYGGTPDEAAVLRLFMSGSGMGLFVVSTVCEFVLPVVVLIWGRARTSITTVTLVAAVVVVGGLVDRIRLYVGAWTVATPTPTEHLPDIPPALPLPGLVELAAGVGPLALTALIVLVVLRSVPPLADWEIKAIERLTPERPFLRTRVKVVARAD